MTPAQALITWLTSSGVTLRLDGDTIVHRGPRCVLNPDVLAKLGQHKAEAIAELKRLANADPPCPADVVERSAIIADGDHRDRATADARALAEHGYPSWQALSDAHRQRILAQLARLPPGNAHGRRLLMSTHTFLDTDHWQAAAALGWSQVELFGVAPALEKAPCGSWGLIVTHALLMPSAAIETIVEDHAVLRTLSGARCVWPRFRPEIEQCVVWWECPAIVTSDEN